MNRPAINRLLLLALCGTLRLVSADETGRPPVTVHDLAALGFDSANLTVAQGLDGVLYVGNEHGLLEYDGVGWQRRELPGGSQARSLYAAPDGRLYYGGMSEFGWFEADDAGDLRAVSLSDSLPEAQRNFLDVRGLHGLSHGVYFRCEQFLARWTGSQLQVWDPEETIHGSAAVDDTLFLQFDPAEGPAWRHLDAARLTDGAGPIPDAAVVERPDPGLFAGNRMLFYLPWPGGRLLGTRYGGLFLERSEGGFEPLDAETNRHLEAENLFDGCLLPGGGVALATLQGGVHLLDVDGRLRAVLDRNTGLPSSTAVAVHVDRQGALWAALFDGLARIDLASPFSRYEAVDGLPGRPLSLVRHRGELLAGTTSGLFRLRPGDAEARPARAPVFEPLPGADGIVWELLSVDESLFAIVGGRLMELDGGGTWRVHGIRQPSALLRSELDPDRLFAWVGDGLLELVRRDGTWTALKPATGLGSQARSLVEDADGALWAGTVATGLLRLERAGSDWNVRAFGAEDGLPAGRTLVFRAGGRMHVSAAGRLFQWDRDLGRLLPDSWIGAVGFDPLAEKPVVREDADGLIWAVLEQGPAIGRPGVDGVVRWDFRTLQPLVGALGAMLPEAGGIAWFGSSKGLLRFDLGRLGDDPPRERVLLREVRLDGQLLFGGHGELPWNEERPLRVEQGESELEISVSLPATTFADRDRYSMRVVGRDRDWSEWTEESAWRIGGLEPGRYSVRVRAVDANDRLAEEAVLALRVPVPWTSSWWFRGLALAALLFLVHLAGSWRSRRLTRINLALQREVEERRRAELARRQSEARYRSLIEQSIDATCVSSPGRLSYINESFRRLFELGSLDVTEPGFDPLILVAPDSQRELRKVEEAVLRGEPVPMPFEFDGRTLNGRLLRLEATMARIPTKDGFVSQAIMRDITERRQLEEQLRQSQKMEAVGRLAGGVAHDFNNILLVIIGQCDMMAMSLDGEDPLRDEIQQVKDAAERAARLTRQLLAFSRKQTLHPQQVSINAVLADLEKMLRRLISEDIEIQLRPAPDLRRVNVDPGQLDQVLVNLVVNARDAMPDGGELTLRTRNVDLDGERAREIGGLEAGPHVLLQVEDTGTGIEPGVVEHIFEPFFTTKSEGRGTGLGLATVYGIVVQSGGAVVVDSEPGRGTRFDIWLPVSERPDAAREEGLADPADLTGSECVLVVEDEDAVRSVIQRTLAGHGYRVEEASDGVEALEKLAVLNGTVDLVLSDMVMPRMGGEELMGEIRRLKPGLPMIVMTGYTDRDLDRRRLEAVGVGLLAKPFGPAALLGALRRRLDAVAAR